ncbi:MAG: GNAT family N-acetyltransferase [Phycisphaerales bacterium]
MTLTLNPALAAPPPPPGLRRLTTHHAAALAHLLYHAYRGTVDDAGESPDDARSEVARLFRGDFGGLDPASLVIELDGIPASPTIITRDKTTIATGESFLAFSMTSPHANRRGLARAGLLQAIHVLSARQEPRLHLVVTRANTPAVRLYESPGFVITGSKP